jgi:hypothetical protein
VQKGSLVNPTFLIHKPYWFMIPFQLGWCCSNVNWGLVKSAFYSVVNTIPAFAIWLVTDTKCTRLHVANYQQVRGIDKDINRRNDDMANYVSNCGHNNGRLSTVGARCFLRQQLPYACRKLSDVRWTATGVPQHEVRNECRWHFGRFFKEKLTSDKPPSDFTARSHR